MSGEHSERALRPETFQQTPSASEEVQAFKAIAPNSETRGKAFRSDIGALRAVAVSLVLLFHFGAPGFKGGFCGVDIFFVISGFLMTSIILQGISRSRFSVVKFYMARVRRIVPALAFMVTTVTLVGYAVLDPLSFRAMASSAVSSIFFVSNFLYANQSGYFAEAATTNWFLHTWSLSVEWQFYMIFPIFMVALNVLPNLFKRSFSLLLIIGAFSLALSIAVLFSGRDNYLSLSFYMLPSRSWELLAGGLVALTPALPARLKAFAVALGLAMIAMSVALFDHRIPWPGVAALLPVVGTSLVLAGALDNAPWTRLPGVQALGRWSYSVYLWHWPLVAGLAYFGVARSFLTTSVAVGAALALGAVSYGLIEQRATRWLFGGGDRRDFLRIAPILAAVGVALGAFLLIPGAWRLRLPPAAAAAAPRLDAASSDWPYPSECASYVKTPDGLELCRLGGRGKVVGLVIGDSHAQQLAARYASLPKGPTDPAVLFATKAGCPMLPGVELQGSVIGCAASATRALDMAASGAYPHVVLAASWMGAMGKTGHQELGRVCFRSGLLCETPTSPPAYAEAASRAFDALSADLARARAAGASVAVLSGFPVADRIGPAALYRTLYDQGALPEAASFSRTGFAGAARWTNDFVGRAAQKAQVALVDPTTHLCSATDCPYIQGARPLYYDDHHLRGATVRGQAFAFLDKLVGLGPT